MSKALVLVAAVVALALPAAVAASGSTTFADKAGDSAGPDITTVAVSNDDQGLVSFVLTIPNRPGLTSGMAVLLFLNTDRSDATGNPKADGADYLLEYDSGKPELAKWGSAGTWDWTTPQSSLTSTYLGGVTLKVSSADLGATTGFSFYAVAAQPGGDGSLQTDFAPDIDQDDWSYSIQIAPPPAAKPPVAATPKPKAKAKPKKKKH